MIPLNRRASPLHRPLASQPGERGIIGNTALVGGIMAAGAFLGHKIDEFKHHHGNN
jgi:hypothetical protein